MLTVFLQKQLYIVARRPATTPFRCSRESGVTAAIQHSSAAREGKLILYREYMYWRQSTST